MPHRVILGVFAGILIAFAPVYVATYMVQLAYPTPPGFDMNDPAAVQARRSALPLSADILMLGGWLLGTGLGSWAAVRISRAAALWPGLIVGALILVTTIENIMAFPHPAWLVAVSLLGVPLSSWLGAKSARGPAIPRKVA